MNLEEIYLDLTQLYNSFINGSIDKVDRIYVKIIPFHEEPRGDILCQYIIESLVLNGQTFGECINIID